MSTSRTRHMARSSFRYSIAPTASLTVRSSLPASSLTAWTDSYPAFSQARCLQQLHQPPVPAGRLIEKCQTWRRVPIDRLGELPSRHRQIHGPDLLVISRATPIERVAHGAVAQLRRRAVADPDDHALLVGKGFIGLGDRGQFIPGNAGTVIVAIGGAEHPIDRRLAFEVLKGGPHEESRQTQQQATNETYYNSFRDRFWHGQSLHPIDQQT